VARRRTDETTTGRGRKGRPGPVVARGNHNELAVDCRGRSAGLQPALDVRNLSMVPNGEIIGRFKPVGDPPSPKAMAGQTRRSNDKRWAPHPFSFPAYGPLDLRLQSPQPKMAQKCQW